MDRSQQVRDIEIKQKLSSDEFKNALRQLMDSLERQQDIHLQVAGRDCTFPGNALRNGKCEVEFEIEDGEYELQLKIKGTP